MGAGLPEGTCRLAALLLLAASSSLSPTPRCSPPATTLPVRFFFSFFFLKEHNTYFPRTFRRLAGGRREIMHLQSLTWLAALLIGGTNTEEASGLSLSKLTEREAEARRAREMSWRLTQPWDSRSCGRNTGLYCLPLSSFHDSCCKGADGIMVRPRLTRVQIVTLPFPSCVALGSHFAS